MRSRADQPVLYKAVEHWCQRRLVAAYGTAERRLADARIAIDQHQRGKTPGWVRCSAHAGQRTGTAQSAPCADGNRSVVEHADIDNVSNAIPRCGIGIGFFKRSRLAQRHRLHPCIEKAIPISSGLMESPRAPAFLVLNAFLHANRSPPLGKRSELKNCFISNYSAIQCGQRVQNKPPATWANAVQEELRTSLRFTHYIFCGRWRVCARRFARDRPGQDVRTEAGPLGAAVPSAAKALEDWGTSVRHQAAAETPKKFERFIRRGNSARPSRPLRYGARRHADLTYINPGYQPGRFPIIGAGERCRSSQPTARRARPAFDAWARQICRQGNEGRQILASPSSMIWIAFHIRKRSSVPGDI